MTTRLLPHSGVSAQDFQRFAMAMGWLEHEFHPATPSSPEEHIWLTEDQRAGVHWLKDGILGLEYVAVTGEEHDAVVDLLTRELPCYTVQEIRAMCNKTVPWYDEVPIINMVAVGGPPVFDDAVFGLIARSMEHEQSAVRNAAIVACAYLGWPQLRPLLLAARDRDPEPELRTLASQLLPTTERDGAG